MKTIRVVAAIIKKDNNIIIAQRMAGDLAGKWEFPGGKIEPNEKAEDALKRELEEEFEVEINIEKYFMTAEWDYPTFHLNMDCFICSPIDEKEIHLNNHTSYEWINIHTRVCQ